MEKLIELVRTSEEGKIVRAIEYFDEPREEIANTLSRMLEAADESDALIHLKFL